MKKIRLQAHRGVSSEFPENTFSAFRASIVEGYDIIELDPKFTSDGKIVILHDRTLNRTGRYTDGSALPEKTEIKNVTFDEVRGYDFGVWMDEKFKGEKIPSLDEVVDFIRSHDIPFKFDNVWETFPDDARETFLSTLEAANLGEKIGFTCRVPACFEEAAKRFPLAEMHWDGANDEETLKAVAEIAKGHRLTVWICYENKRTTWFKGAKASAELCNTARKYGEVGIWILSDESELDSTINIYDADVIETTGHIKPAMLEKFN